MRLNKPANRSTIDHLVINNQPINIFDDFKYIGSFVGSMEHDLQVRIGLAWAAFAKLKSILTSPKPWNQQCYQIMLGIQQSRDHVTNERLYQRVNQVPIREMIRERQLKFTDHFIRMHTDEPVKP